MVMNFRAEICANSSFERAVFIPLIFESLSLDLSFKKTLERIDSDFPIEVAEACTTNLLAICLYETSGDTVRERASQNLSLTSGNSMS
jgi:hypothetical protein